MKESLPQRVAGVEREVKRVDTEEKLSASSRLDDIHISSRLEKVGRRRIVVPANLFDDAGAAATAQAAAIAASQPLSATLTALATNGSLGRPTSGISTNITLVANSRYIVDSSAGVRIEVLPASPADGDEIWVKRVGGNTVTLNGNGNNVEGAGSYDLTVDGQAVVIVYDITLDAWYVW